MHNPWRQKLSQMIPMRDGVKLSCDIRFPVGDDGPYPAVLFRTPYNKAMDLKDPQVTRWTREGYAFVTQDCRGRHESEGDFRPHIQDVEDGADTIAWIRDQPFCNGKVSMTGASYCGWTQLAAASANPEGLVAIIPQVMCTDGVESTTNYVGITGMTQVWWSLLNTNRSQMADPVGDWDRFLAQLPANQLDEMLGFCPIPAFKLALNPERVRRHREEMTVLSRLEENGLPILSAVGWYDVFGSGSMKDASRIIRTRREQGLDNFRVIAGPWDHGLCQSTGLGDLDFGPSSLIDLPGLQNAFVRHFMKGTPLPPELEKPVFYFMMGSNVWRSSDNWPPEDARAMTLYLDSGCGANSLFGDGSLSANLPEGREADEYTYNPLNPVPAIGGAGLFLHAPSGPMDQRPVERRDDVLCYTTDVLEKPLAFAGIPMAEIHVASSAVDTDFFVRLCDVHPDGRSVLICDGGRRLGCRGGGDTFDPAVPGQPCFLKIELGSTAMCIQQGHRLRVEITSSCFPRFVRNLNSSKEPTEETESDAVEARQLILHTTARASRIMLPVMPSE